MPKRFEIDIDSYEEFFIIGICTTYSAHKLAWALNKVLQTQFARAADFVVNQGTSEAHYAFLMDEQNSAHHYYIIENSSEAGVLVQEQKNINFFMLIKELSDEEFSVSSLIQKMYSESGITFIVELKKQTMDKKLNDKWNMLLNDIELYLMNLSKTQGNGKY